MVLAHFQLDTTTFLHVEGVVFTMVEVIIVDCFRAEGLRFGILCFTDLRHHYGIIMAVDGPRTLALAAVAAEASTLQTTFLSSL